MNRLFKYLVLSVSLAALASCSGKLSSTGKKVLVLAFDGMDPRIVQSMFDKGMLPNLKRLSEAGSFRQVWSSVPPQSPVAWSNFITGKNPGGHGIFDFIHRDPKTYLPFLSMSDTLPPQRVLNLGSFVLPLSRAEVVLNRKGKAFWEYLAEKEIPVTVFCIPSNYPPVKAGKALSGMGTPDLRGTYGTYQYFTTDPADVPEDYGGARIEVVTVEGGKIAESILGPPNTFRREAKKGPDGLTKRDNKGEIEYTNPDLSIPFTVYLDPENPVARIDLPDQDIILKQGEWSDWVVLSFQPLPLLGETTAIARFYLKEVRPKFRLYVTPLNVDPLRPALPIDSPNGFAKELAEANGEFYTLGMPEDTKALTNNTFTTEEFYTQAMMVLAERNRNFDYLLDRFTGGFFFFYYSSTDLGTHIFWHLRDTAHPRYDAAAREKLGDVIEEIYQEMDKVVGKVMARLDDRTTLIIMSDHGFGPFYRNFHLNTWLEQNGYLVLRDGAHKGSLYGDVDWNRTRAYALGFNGLYLNLQGRELYGSVHPSERERLLDELVMKLEAVRDPETAKPVIRRALKSEEAYHGPYTALAPDILVGYDWGYRSSWESVLGDVTGILLADNQEKWSGDHCGATGLVPGVLFSNQKILLDNPHLYDLAPSILSEFGLPKPPDMDGENVFWKPKSSEQARVRSLPYL
ncbi:MAG: alkaline phosphatase family protein [Candidatus Aureabacteria bacterium]|nr:alkaline phosphatase family protein [Candidatus Auribacterota bacterium]